MHTWLVQYGHIPILAAIVAHMGGLRYYIAIKKNGKWSFKFRFYLDHRGQMNRGDGDE